MFSGEKPSIRGALWNIPSNACPDCERIAADMQP